MNATLPFRLPRRFEAYAPFLLVLAGGVFAVSLAVGTVPEGFPGLLLAGGLCALGLLYVSIVAPRVPLAILFAEVVAFPVLPILQNRGLNPEDILLPVLVLVTWLFLRDRPAEGPHAALVEARRRAVLRCVAGYYSLALFSLFLLTARGHGADAFDSLIALARSAEGALFFYLVSRHAVDKAGVFRVRNAVLGGIFVVFAINLFAVAAGGVPRAGSSIIFGMPADKTDSSWAIGSLPFVMTNPNELGAACALVWAILIGIRPRRSVFVLGLACTFILLLMSQSRSGMLSWITLVLLLGLRRGHRKLLLLPVFAVALLPLLPGPLRDRIVRTVLLERGSFEAYSSLIRVFSWQTAWKVILAHPLFGVGYLGFRFVSHLYNNLGVRLFTCEEFFLETAVGMGILGPIVAAAIGIAIVRLGALCRKLGEPGSVAHDLGNITPAFVCAVAVGNLTGDNLIGLLGVSQLALFVGVLAQVSRIPECQRARGTTP
jgi:hypothetical protein